jgi:hypothetical protein
MKEGVSKLKILEGEIEIIAKSLKKSCKCATILIADDNEFNRFILKQMLNAYGLTTSQVNLLSL